MERSENLFPVMSQSGHVNRIRGLFFFFFFVPLVNLLDSGYGYMMHTLHGLSDTLGYCLKANSTFVLVISYQLMYGVESQTQHFHECIDHVHVYSKETG